MSRAEVSMSRAEVTMSRAEVSMCNLATESSYSIY